jgi:hypothetical protein
VTVTTTAPATTETGTTTTTTVKPDQESSGPAKIVIEKSGIIPSGKTGNDYIYEVGLVLRNVAAADANYTTMTVNLVDQSGTLIGSGEHVVALMPAHSTTY